MKKLWRVVLTLDVNSRGADLERWERTIERHTAVEAGSAMIERRDSLLYVSLVVGSESPDFDVSRALRFALNAYRRSYRSMHFKGVSAGLITSMSIAEHHFVLTTEEKGSE